VLAYQETPSGPDFAVRWPAPEVPSRYGEPVPSELTDAHVVSRVPVYRRTGEHWLVPVVGDGQDFLPPVLLWWVMLFGLSLLARYEPAAWRAALDLDRRPMRGACSHGVTG
jgi:hypothetical protein